MIQAKILDVKQFMGLLLLSDTFDSFLLTKADITTFNTFSIDGKLQKDYYSEDLPTQTHSAWAQVRPFCLNLIRGKRTPLAFQIIFQLSSGNTQKLLTASGVAYEPETVSGLYLNLRFSNGILTYSTGTSVTFFTLDKSLDQAWDQMVQKFFQKNGISAE